MREGYSSQFVSLSTCDCEDDGIFMFDAGINDLSLLNVAVFKSKKKRHIKQT